MPNITDSRFTKKVDSYIALQQEVNTLKTLFSGFDSDDDLLTDLTFTRCDREDASTKYGNYFMSFNLPTASSRFSTASTLSEEYPELQQLNVDKIVMCPIPTAYYSEFIDGKTITFSVPQNGGADQDNLSAITLISSTYTSEKILKKESSPLLGDNVVFLFCNDINKPYTGLTTNAQGVEVDNAAVTSWDPTGIYNERPSAVTYREVVPNLETENYNTDQRTNTHYSVKIDETYPEGRAGYNYDIPVGFAILDKGFVVITHTGITENIPWTSGYTLSDDTAYTTGNLTDIYFTGTTDGAGGTKAGVITFKDIDTTFKMSTVCLGMPREFYVSFNPTWDRSKVIEAQLEDQGYINFDSVYVTEVGLYNAFGELIAVSKLSEPVEKSYTNVITFNIDIEM